VVAVVEGCCFGAHFGGVEGWRGWGVGRLLVLRRGKGLLSWLMLGLYVWLELGNLLEALGIWKGREGEGGVFIEGCWARKWVWFR